MALTAVRSKAVVRLLLSCCRLLLPLWDRVIVLCFVVRYFVPILVLQRDLIALLCLSFWCLIIVAWLFLMMPWVRLKFVIVIFPYHTHLRLLRVFLKKGEISGNLTA